MKLFCDLDGVLADFDKAYFDLFGKWPERNENGLQTSNDDKEMWKVLDTVPDFFFNLEPTRDAFDLWDYIKQYNPTILTGIPNPGKPDGSLTNSSVDKKRWVAKYFGEHVPVITTKSRYKCKYREPGDILIDDWLKYAYKWKENDGIFILHLSAENTILQLKEVIKNN